MKHCPDCGTKYKSDAWPRKCEACGGIKFQNPTPVVVALIPVDNAALVGAIRGIEPQKGQIALPGGFLDMGETAEEGVEREVREESGLTVIARRIFHVQSTPDNTKVLMFWLCDSITSEEFHEARERVEAGAYPETERVFRITRPLNSTAFTSHTEAIRRWFKR